MAVHSYKDFLYIRIYLELYMLNKAAFKKNKNTVKHSEISLLFKITNFCFTF